MEQKHYSLEELEDIIAQLRSDHGCPWDRAQTHESLRPCLTEEANELLAAIRIYQKTKNPDNMKEELGDLLMQVVLHSRIAEEEGLFTMEDVIGGICEKMIRRHPHVFGDVDTDDEEAISRNWEAIKRQEKEQQSWVESPLREIPTEHPALTRAPKVLKKIDALYAPRDNYEACLLQLADEVQSLQNCTESPGEDRRGMIAERMGKILLTVSDIARIEKMSNEQILNDEIEKLIEYYEASAENDFPE